MIKIIKFYTKQFDEIEKAEFLETSEEITKLKKKLRSTTNRISGFNYKTSK